MAAGGATTLDWGDVQPEQDVKDCRLLGKSSHLAIDVYDNAMFVGAIDDFLYLCKSSTATGGDLLSVAAACTKHDWAAIRKRTATAVRTHLWNTTATPSQFKPHLYFDLLPATAGGIGLTGSPFPASFDESALYYHGGTAQAALAGLLTAAELSLSLAKMEENVAAAGGKMTVGLTVRRP